MRQISLTKGNIWQVLLRFSIPFLLANLLQALYGAVDLMVIGAYCSAESIAAVSTGTQITQIITSLISGLTLGGTILVAKYTGKQNNEKVARTISTTIVCFAIISVILTIFMMVSLPYILTLLQVPSVSRNFAYQYVMICCAGIFFICEYNALCSILRGYGDSMSPFIFAGIACICNIIGDIYTVGYLHMGVCGSAISTIISQGVSMIIAYAYLRRKQWPFGIRLSSLRMDIATCKELIYVGVPVSFQECMVRISFLYLTAITNGFGIYAASAVGIAGKFDIFAMLPATSISAALTAITAQNMAANQPKRAIHFVRKGMMISFACALMFFLWAQMSPETMIAMFSKDAQVTSYGVPFIRTCSIDYLAVSILFNLNAYLNGCEKTMFTMINCCAGALLIRTPLLYLLSSSHVNVLAYYGFVSPLSSIIMMLVIVLYLKKWHVLVKQPVFKIKEPL